MQRGDAPKSSTASSDVREIVLVKRRLQSNGKRESAAAEEELSVEVGYTAQE